MLLVVIWGGVEGDDVADAILQGENLQEIITGAISWCEWISSADRTSNNRHVYDCNNSLNDKNINTKEGVLSVVSASAPCVSEKRGISLWRPFPVHELPEPFRSFIQLTAAARQCDSAAVALPLLSSLAAVIGNTRVICIWEDWYAPSIIWSAVICPSGAVKTPAFRAALDAINRLSQKAMERFTNENQLYEEAEVWYQAKLKDWHYSKPNNRGEPPRKPDKPLLRRYIVEDITLQALVQRLAENPRGLLLARDELSGWIRSFDQFTATTGADVARYLEMYRAGPLSVDRVGTGNIWVPRAALSICGTIQDEVATRVFSGEHQANGLLARFILARPPEPQRTWNPHRTAASVTEEVASRFAALNDLCLAPDNEKPHALGLSVEAGDLYGSWFNALNEMRRDTEPGPFRAALAKIEELPARLGLILALGRVDNPSAVEVVDGNTMQRALAITDWSIWEIERVLAMFSETQEQRADRELIDWISRHVEGVTARDLVRALRRYKGQGGTDRAKADLLRLVTNKQLVVEERPMGPKGGRTNSIFHVVLCNERNPADTADADTTSGHVFHKSYNINQNNDLEKIQEKRHGEVVSAVSAVSAFAQAETLESMQCEEDEEWMG
ncbi:MAG: DUF3987 domain-containing protein [Planctomycetota bacterium]